MVKLKGRRLLEQDVVRLYETMCLARYVQDEANRLAVTSKIRGMLHTAQGQEAVVAGLCVALEPDDYLATTHRGFADCVAKGMTARSMMAELFASSEGAAGGRGGDMHILDFSKGVLGTTGLVGGNVVLAVGAAFTCKYKGWKRVAATIFSDGGTAQGVVHESMNLARVWNLPVLFVRANNHYGGRCPDEYSISMKDICAWARSYGMPAFEVDGMDVFAVYEAAREAAAQSRAGGGPCFLECDTYNLSTTSSFETDVSYKPLEERERYEAREPVRQARDRILAERLLTGEEVENIEARARDVVSDAIAYAQAAPVAPPDHTYRYVYATEPTALSRR